MTATDAETNGGATTARLADGQAKAKARAVGTMFDGIARRYDLLNRLMSAGLDGHWRRVAVARLTPLPLGNAPLLDIGAGTADLTIEMRRQRPERPAVGVDLSAGMLCAGLVKVRARGVRCVALARGDAMRLPFADGAFAGAATAFTLRNVADVPTALAEVRRVLTPGAPFACLEITRPRGGISRRLFGLYFGRVLPHLTGLISGAPVAYRYLPESVERFQTGDELVRTMREAGFSGVRMRRFWPGAVTLHVGRA